MTDNTEQISIGKSNKQFSLIAETGKGGKKITDIIATYTLADEISITITAKPETLKSEDLDAIQVSVEMFAPNADHSKNSYDASIPSRDNGKKAVKKLMQKLANNNVSEADQELISKTIKNLGTICDAKSDSIFGADKLKSIAHQPELSALAKENIQHFSAGKGRG